MITAKCDRQIGRDFVQKTFTISPWGNAAIGSLFDLDKIITNEAGTLITKGEGIVYY